MTIDRRHLLTLGAVTAAAGPGFATDAASAAPPPASLLGVDASHYGLNPGSPDNQSKILQRAIDDCARRRLPLAIGPGLYRVGDITLRTGAQIFGVRNATRLLMVDGPSLLSGTGARGVTLSNLMLDGARRKPENGRALVHLQSCRDLRIADCEIVNAGGDGIHLVAAEGEVIGNSFTAIGDTALFSNDAAGLAIVRNTIIGAGNNGILVFRSRPGNDGTIVADNRIEHIVNRSGGSGQYGNAINIFRAHNVVVRGNRIRKCAFTGVRGNAASNIQVSDNGIEDVGEVAIYSEFGFQGAAIRGNIVDGAAVGISVTNFNEGGRLAVVQGNIVRNLVSRRPKGTDPGDAAGVGISAEADTAITGNVVEGAPNIGILLGWGKFLRDVNATGNVTRKCTVGVGVSVSPGAGAALIAHNLIAESKRGAIVGMDKNRLVTLDLGKSGDNSAYPHLTIVSNRVR